MKRYHYGNIIIGRIYLIVFLLKQIKHQKLNVLKYKEKIWIDKIIIGIYIIYKINYLRKINPIKDIKNRFIIPDVIISLPNYYEKL